MNSSTALRTFFRVNPRPLYCEIVDSLPKLMRLATKMMKVEEFAFDTETNSLRVLGPNKDLTVVGISISWGLYDNYYIPLGHKRFEDYGRQIQLATVVSYMKPVFEREDIRIIGHNITFDMHVMSRLGIFIKTKDLFCTQTASWICDENVPKGLKDNSAEKLGIKQTRFNDVVKDVPNEVKKEFGLKASNKATFDLTLIDDSAPYAIDDAFNTWVLYLGFLDLLEHEEMDKIYNKVYVPLMRTIFDMERVGVDVDLERLEEMSVEMSKDMEELEYEMFKIAGVEFNPASSQQLAELLFGYVKQDRVNKKTGKTTKAKVNKHILDVAFNFPVQSVTDGGAPQTNNATLWKLSLAEYKVKRKAQGVELCKLLMQYKKIGKLKSAFVDGLKEQMYDDGKVHPSFNITGTDSGRFSCSSPNLQQLPNADDNDKYQIRSLFRGSVDSETGQRKKIISLDYANLEMRILAHFCVQRNMPIAFADGSSEEIGRIVQKCDESTSVLSYDFDTGKVVEKPITNFWKNGKSNIYDKPDYKGSETEWLRITNNGDYSRLVVTPGHKIFTTEGKKSAKDLKVGDSIYYNCPEINGDIKELLIGIALGDSHFVNGNSLVYYHAKSQSGYFNWKNVLLKDFITGNVQTDGEILKSTVKSNVGINNFTKHFIFSDDCSHKAVCDSIVKDMTLKSLAIWYLDDGNMTHDSRCSEYKGYGSVIARGNLDESFVEALNAKFKTKFKFNLGSGMSCYGDNALEFFKLIADYAPECMSYKFPKFIWGQRQPYEWDVRHKDVTGVDIVSIEQVEIGDPLFKNSLTQSGYDLEVMDTHNYFANNILVSNSEDKNLLEMFEAGADTHGSTAVNMFELDCDPNEVKALYPHLRVAAKTINFLLMYGGGAYTLYNKLLEDQESPINLGEKKYLEQYDVRKGEDVAQIYIDRYFTSYSGVADFIKNQKRLAHRHMYVYTLLKRKRRLYDIQSGDYKIVAYCERLSVNSAVQGSAADVVISAQNRIASDPWFEQNRVTMLLQVHDEIVFEAPEEKIEEAIGKIKRYMEHPFGDDVELNLPLIADSGFGDTYQTAK